MRTILLLMLSVGISSASVCDFHNFSGTNFSLAVGSSSWLFSPGDCQLAVSPSFISALSTSGVELDTNSDWDVMLSSDGSFSYLRRIHTTLFYPQTGDEPFILFDCGFIFISCVIYLLRSFV